jgi:hypothetical protein
MISASETTTVQWADPPRTSAPYAGNQVTNLFSRMAASAKILLVIPSLLLGTIAGMVAGGVAALILGYLCVRHTRIYFSMLTLCFGMMIYSLAWKWRDVTGGDDGLVGIPRAPFEIPGLFSINMSQMGIMGHFMGGMASLIAASRNPEIKAVVALAAPYLGNIHFDDANIEEFRSTIDWTGVFTATKNIIRTAPRISTGLSDSARFTTRSTATTLVHCTRR